MVCSSATSEAEARWPRFGLVVVATTSRRDNKVQMIRPLKCGVVTKNSHRFGKSIKINIHQEKIIFGATYNLGYSTLEIGFCMDLQDWKNFLKGPEVKK
jgi:hypothetical protein